MKGALRALVVLGMTFGVAGVAHAENWPARSMSLEVSGHITSRCQLTQHQRQADFGDILDRRNGTSAGGAIALGFELDCNAPVRLTLSSANGGLRWEGASATSDPDFARQLPYRASARLGPSGEARILSCESAEMRDLGPNAPCRATTTDIGKGEGEIQLTLERGGGLLLNGQYTDTLVMSVSPLVGGERTGVGK